MLSLSLPTPYITQKVEKTYVCLDALSFLCYIKSLFDYLLSVWVIVPLKVTYIFVFISLTSLLSENGCLVLRNSNSNTHLMVEVLEHLSSSVIYDLV